MKKLAAELFGTFSLIFAGTGAIIINDLTAGVVSHVGVAFTFGLIVLAMIYAVGDISGAHLNPAGVHALRPAAMTKGKGQAGLTLVELIVAFTILLILSSMVVPMTRYQIRRARESELRNDLREMRTAIHRYKDLCDEGKIQATGNETYCYPSTLEEGIAFAESSPATGHQRRREPVVSEGHYRTQA